MKVLQCQENETKLKRFLHKYLPYLPASFPSCSSLAWLS